MSRAIAHVALLPATGLARLCAVAFSTILAIGLLSGSALAGPHDAALDAAINAAMARGPAPGMIVGIWQDGQEPYVKAFGVRDTATGQPMTTDLHMRIGSNTKSFTVTSILMLADQGKLHLDDTIDRYFKGAPGGDRVTLRQLAAMRSGLYDYSDAVIQERSCSSALPSARGRRASSWRSRSGAVAASTRR
jgi:D-alanyl-D-alanine carboxypeptidase